MIGAYGALFGASFLAATFVPFSSEVVLAALVLAGGDLVLAWAVASTGNTLGGLFNWGLGRGIERWRDHPWFPVGPAALERAGDRFRRYGAWGLACSWLPLVGDPLTLAAGVFRYPLLPFLILVGLGKAGRYGVLVAGIGGLGG